ncbi:DEAD/DEAH box helicase [Cellvibrio sp.]|uniref:DEAD/DEAH box helicase n=1 Tax=Cellvibrio sp. TaxID=1965322 RepID=UPI0039647EEE
MGLRQWQSNCIRSALVKYHGGQRHFLCLATPAAGKTRMASTLAALLLQKNKIDLVLCFSPSVIVATDFQSALEQQLKLPVDGRLGSKGQSLTYQSMLGQQDSFWALFDRYRIFVIFDEIHHCAGDSPFNANAWGHQIIARIQGRAAFTLALTGTPWRSDRIPISLASYAHDDKVHCDFMYGLQEAVRDNVCRAPAITLVDNNRIRATQGGEEKIFSSFGDLLKESDCSYQDVIENEALMTYLLEQSAKKLRSLRKHHADAAGLIVAASVEHAYKIADSLQRCTGDTAVVVTYMGDAPQAAIAAFRTSSEPWIISVGMVSEGTNIPRLRVCCHLTRVKTELHFRQVLGRILRTDGIHHGDSYLYVPAEPSLAEYAGRVIEEIPHTGTLRRNLMPSVLVADDSNPALPGELASITINPLQMDFTGTPVPSGALPMAPPITQGSLLAHYYEANINMFGRFKQQLLTLQRLCA